MVEVVNNLQKSKKKLRHHLVHQHQPILQRNQLKQRSNHHVELLQITNQTMEVVNNLRKSKKKQRHHLVHPYHLILQNNHKPMSNHHVEYHQIINQLPNQLALLTVILVIKVNSLFSLFQLKFSISFFSLYRK
jgi:hypothetical protein